MKILHIGKYFPPFHGGMENFLDDLVREQVRVGNEVLVLCHQHKRGCPTETCQSGSGAQIVRVAIMGVAAYAPVAPGFYQSLRKVLTEFKPDVVHVHMPNVSAFWLLFIKKSFKLVIHWHSDVVSSENEWKLRTLYPFYSLPETRLLAKADVIIPTSTPYLETSFPLKRFKKKCRVIPLGIKRNKFGSEMNHADSGSGCEGDEYIFSVGRFTYYKGFKYLIRACKDGYPGRLVIAGDGPLRADMQRLVQSSGLGSRVSLPGRLSHFELQQCFKKCRAFCLPSIERTEAFGVVLLEAMSLGKPLITTRVEGSGMNEVNVHNETGLVVEPADSVGLARAMNYMLQNRARAEEMGSRGRARLQEKFSIERVVWEVGKVY
ncbi:glycosyltransferase [Desulfonatronovibrio magnus]|uniref:glycosyltransferase n=1 Tax=Desulfonatronovibrio magnus TaxID=698827 RepID=UPI0005EB1CB5|nr:glycosyltransferase [Desulfonatronovibrio magnus]